MPNHVTNRLIIIGTEEQVKQVREAIKGEREDQFLDFNKIAPIPKELEGTVSPMRILSQKEYDEQERKIRENDLTDNERNWGLSRGLTQELADEYIAKFGHCDWYGWQNANWGTKWNAYSQHEIGEDCIEFDTAWSTPYELMVKLSKLFPEIEFQVEYADEDFGYNVGTYTLLDGDSIDENIPDGGSREAIMMAMDIKGDEDYYLTDYLCYDTDDEELSEFEETLVEIAHEKGFLIDEYPTSVLNKLKELALANEQFERVIEIDKLLSVKETETEE
jgi:hypothetical protein